MSWAPSESLDLRAFSAGSERMVCCLSRIDMRDTAFCGKLSTHLRLKCKIASLLTTHTTDGIADFFVLSLSLAQGCRARANELWRATDTREPSACWLFWMRWWCCTVPPLSRETSVFLAMRGDSLWAQHFRTIYPANIRSSYLAAFFWVCAILWSSLHILSTLG